MSELGDTFKAWHEHKKQKKADNKLSSLKILLEAGYIAEVLSDSHYRIGHFDFWPSTGKYLNRNKHKYGRGVFNLLKELRATIK